MWQKVSGCARSCQELPPDFPDRSFLVQEMILEGKGTMTGWDSHSLVRKCQELKGDCQELPGVVRSCQELSGVARSCQDVWQKVSGCARSCQRLSGVARACKKFPGCARSFQEVPGVVWMCKKVSGSARRCQEAPGVARSCLELPSDFPDMSFIVQEMMLEGEGAMTRWDSHSLVRRCQE